MSHALRGFQTIEAGKEGWCGSWTSVSHIAADKATEDGIQDSARPYYLKARLPVTQVQQPPQTARNQVFKSMRM